MPRYTPKKSIVNAVQFSPDMEPWPDGVNPWPDENGLRPRDMSFGYMMLFGIRYHVWAGDWIVTGNDPINRTTHTYPISKSEFEQDYEEIP